VDELDDDAADELGDGAAQLVFDERLERFPGRRGHVSESTTRRAGLPGRTPIGVLSEREKEWVSETARQHL
jgi:hypothetical protein